jgi:hypothetical protein
MHADYYRNSFLYGMTERGKTVLAIQYIFGGMACLVVGVGLIFAVFWL